MVRGLALVLVVIVALVGHTGCSSDNPQAPSEVTGLSIVPAAFPVMVVGATQQVVAAVSETDGTARLAEASDGLRWSVDAEAVATITPAGLLTARAAGKATVTATIAGGSGAKTATAAVVVSAATLRVLTLSPATVSVAVGATQQLAATATFSDGTRADVTAAVKWTSAAEGVATVTGGGLVKGVREGGPVALTATSGDVAGTVDVTVSPAGVTKLAIESDATGALPLGLTRTFRATATDSAGSSRVLANDPKLVWRTSDSGMATIGNDGVATARKAGSVQISATYVDGAVAVTSPSVALQVSDATLVALALAPAAISVPAGYSRAAVATGRFSDQSSLDVTEQPIVTFSTDDTAVATVASSPGIKGRVAGVAAGRTTLRVRAGSGPAAIEATSSVDVTSATLASATLTPYLFDVRIGGAPVTFAATGQFSDGATLDVTREMTFTTDSPAQVVLTANVARASATAIPTPYVSVAASRGGVVARAYGRVSAAPAPKSVVVTLDAPDRALGMTTRAHATLVTTDGVSVTAQEDVTGRVTWTSGDVTRATVDATGLVTAAAATTAAGVPITAAWTSPVLSGSATLRVTDCPVGQLTLNTAPPAAGAPPSAFAPIGSSFQLFSRVTMTSSGGCQTAGLPDGTVLDVTDMASVAYSSSDSGVATVTTASPRGKVTVSAAPSAPSATLTALYGPLVATFVVRPIAPRPVYAFVLPASFSLPLGNRAQVTLMVHFDDGQDIDVTASAATSFSTPTPSVASVTMTGQVSANSPGTAAIRGCFSGVATVCTNTGPSDRSATVTVVAP